eukprot:CAMPEP_0171695508 /NCGR_PEP_ID=MMETSP0991-20121206/7798_1 /TAXON_ID=483369 /ORGANISM="non described non described, Strain CCMP2098" /LENGTH=932 /DNA_ID=CAMNT_0012284185 /DNA_START=237 /DNA_END=3036 /DNA_ORIENTATION=+
MSESLEMWDNMNLFEEYDLEVKPTSLQTLQFTHMCSGLIDYKFFLPLNVTQSAYSFYTSALGYGLDGSYDSTCLAAYKKNLCAKMYLRCPDNLDMEDVATYNMYPYLEGGFPLPFDRPSKSNCEAVYTACGYTGEFLGAVEDCNEINTLTSVGVYSTQSDECYTSLTSPSSTIIVEVAEPLEPYIFTEELTGVRGTCEGIADMFYTPAWDTLYSSRQFVFIGSTTMRGALVVAPLLSPYVMQEIVELSLNLVWEFAGFNTAGSRNSECQIAEQMFWCGTAFAPGEHQSQLSYLTDYYTQQRASHAVCEKYLDACGHNFYQGATLSNLMLGHADRVQQTAWQSTKHCGQKEPYLLNMSWYASEPEEIAVLPSLGTVVRSPWNMENAAPRLLIEDSQTICKFMNGINHPPVPKTKKNSKTNWGDPLMGMDDAWWWTYNNNVCPEGWSNCGSSTDNWKNKVCPEGWSEYNDECPWSFEQHHDIADCLKSCYQWANVMEPMRDPEENELINKWDYAFLSITFVLMTYMVVTWTIFREKSKQRVVLVLSTLMWLQTLIELLGYIIYPKSDDRFCENDAVPHHHGFNYCAVSAMLVHGIISPMFQLMIACMALDVYLKVIMNMKNKNHYWQYYTAGSFIVAICCKFIPVFLIWEVGGFDGVNACGYTFWLRQPNSIFSPTPVEEINPNFNLELYEILLMNTVEHFAWVVSVGLFTRIIVAVVRSLNKVSVTAGKGESVVASALKQIRVVKTPVLMIFFFTLVSSAQIYCWDVYAIENWSYFGPGGARPEKNWNNIKYLSLWFQSRLPEQALAFQTWDNINTLTKIMNYYIKIINHFAFPLLLFTVFGMNKENKKLWAQKLGLGQESDSSSGGSSADWTIVKQNEKIKKLGVTKYFGQIFNKRSTINDESSFQSSWRGPEASTVEIADFGTTAEASSEA